MVETLIVDLYLCEETKQKILMRDTYISLHSICLDDVKCQSINELSYPEYNRALIAIYSPYLTYKFTFTSFDKPGYIIAGIGIGFEKEGKGELLKYVKLERPRVIGQ